MRYHIYDIDGEGRGGMFFNTETPMELTKDGHTVTILEYDGYEDEDSDEEWDDFGSQFYWCTAVGTKEALDQFVESLREDQYSDREVQFEVKEDE